MLLMFLAIEHKINEVVLTFNPEGGFKDNLKKESKKVKSQFFTAYFAEHIPSIGVQIPFAWKAKFQLVGLYI